MGHSCELPTPKENLFSSATFPYLIDDIGSASSSFSSCSSEEFYSTEFEHFGWNILEENLDTLDSIVLQTEMESVQVIEGFMERKEDNGLFPKWTRSFFRLCGSKLFFTDENMIVIDYIDLLQVKAVHNCSSKSLKFSIEDYCGHKYLLRPENDTLKVYWTVKIRSVARYLQQELTKPSSKPQSSESTYLLKNAQPVTSF